MSFKRTGVFASKEELEQAKSRAQQAATTPVICLSTKAAIEGRDLASLAWERAMNFCHEIALKHGLPEIPGRYGLAQNGEFVSMEEP